MPRYKIINTTTGAVIASYDQLEVVELVEVAKDESEETTEARYQRNVTELVIERLDNAQIIEEVVEPLMEGLVRKLVTATVKAVIDEMDIEGFCSFTFHKSSVEFMADGRCESCHKPKRQHDTFYVCRGSDSSDAVDRVRHRLEMHDLSERARMDKEKTT